MKKNLYLFVLLFFMAGSLVAQTVTVTGTVNNDEGQTLPGVSIVIKGTTQGTVTDVDGHYSIKCKKGDVLRFSYIGYDSKEITVEDQKVINVTLESGVSLNEVIVTGTRFGGRTAIETPVPVDVLDVKTITSVAAQTDLNQMMNYQVPSFTSNTQTISDGTDEVDPASLRGLGPDQVLVLVNGKRRHPSSLINVNGTFGRGNVGTDMNTLPASAIQSIQVLRDGAAAQYGSDAIAGVINVILKKNINQLSVNLTSGAYASKNSNALEGGIDGPMTNLGVNYGIGLGKNGGFINFTGEFNYRDYYNRMGTYTGSIFHGYNVIEWQAYNDGADISKLSLSDIQKYAQMTSVFDQSTKDAIAAATSLDDVRAALTDDEGNIIDYTEAELAERGQTRHDYIMRVGQSALRGGKFFANMELPLDKNGTEFYAFGGTSYRHGDAAGFYRLPNQNRTYTPIYINGFLPHIETDILDKSLSMGIRGTIKGWDVDFSNTYGGNRMMYTVTHSLNASLQNASKTSYNSGGFEFSQNTVNLDVSKRYADVMAGLNIAWGAEYRNEHYQIFAGAEGSYATYDTLGLVIKSPYQVAPTDFFGRSRPGGVQVFPGFRPENELSKYRNNVGGYVDVEANFSERLLLDGALRYENYSDFGSTLNGKLATRFKVADNFNIRASVNTGFRAPSLQQIYFNSTSTLFNDVGIPEEVGLFSNDSKVADILGIPKLKQETSQSASIGITAKIPAAFLKITADAYVIAIQNRIVLTGQFKPTTPELEKLFSMAGATKAAFFANAIDTRSQGLDIVLENNLNLGPHTTLVNTLSGTFSKTVRVGDIHASPILEESGQLDVYFDERAQIFLEKAVPHTKINLSNLFTYKKWNIFLRNVYFGSVTEANNIPERQQVFSPKVITDLSVGFNLTNKANITVGANNLFDIYPDENIPENQSSGRFIWSRRSQQFGFGGRFIFARLRLDI